MGINRTNLIHKFSSVLCFWIAVSCNAYPSDHDPRVFLHEARDIRDPLSIDLGSIQSGKDVALIVRIKNLTGKELIPGSAESDCGCLVAKIAEDRWSTNTPISIRVRLHAEQVLGKIQRRLRLNLRSVEGQQPHSLDVAFSGRVVGPVSLVDNQVRVRQGIDSSVRLNGEKSDPKFTITRVRSLRNLVSDIKIEQDSTQFHLILAARMQFGSGVDQLRFDYTVAGDKAAESVTIPIHVVIADAARFMPSTLSMYPSKSGWSGSVKVLSTDAQSADALDRAKKSIRIAADQIDAGNVVAAEKGVRATISSNRLAPPLLHVQVKLLSDVDTKKKHVLQLKDSESGALHECPLVFLR